MIAIVDYGCGNLYSLQCSLNFLNLESKITSNPEDIKSADKIILPGVGAFGDAVELLRESGLDKVGEGEEDYIRMLHSFYDDFDRNLQKVKAEMDGVKIQLKEDETDIPCEKCGRMMVIKTGRFGKFLACPGYPECKTTKPYVVETEASCPVCGGKVISKKSKRGYTFFGCDNWPVTAFLLLRFRLCITR